MVDVRRCPSLAAAAGAAGGVVGLEQCRAAGLTDEQLAWLVESGRWQSPFPRTFVAFSGPFPRDTAVEAALAYAGPAAVASGETAGAYWGLCAWPDAVHVTVPYPSDAENQPGLRIHRSRRLSSDDAHPTLRPRRLRIEPSVLDLLRTRRTLGAALGLAADAIRSRQTTALHLRMWLGDRQKTRWRRQILLALPDIAAGAHSVLELKDASLRRQHGLPAGERQFRRRRDGTEFLDVVIKEYGVHVELDGRLGHDRAQEVWRDMSRDNASEVRRLRHLRYGWDDMLGRPCHVAIEQAVVLRQQGWADRFRRCRHCPATLPPGL
jgi:hypothetical protein